MSRGKLVSETVAAQAFVKRLLVRASINELLELDMTMAQLKTLGVVEREPNCTIGMLSEELGIKLAAASLAVDKLERAGLVRRHSHPLDGRRVMVEPTTEGKRLISRIREAGRSQLQSWVGELSEDDLSALHRGSRALARIAAGKPVASRGVGAHRSAARQEERRTA